MALRVIHWFWRACLRGFRPLCRNEAGIAMFNTLGEFVHHEDSDKIMGVEGRIFHVPVKTDNVPHEASIEGMDASWILVESDDVSLVFHNSNIHTPITMSGNDNKRKVFILGCIIISL